MSNWKTLVACALAGTLMAGQLEQAAAAPLPTNVGTMKAMVPEGTTQVHWRGGWHGGGIGFGFGALAAGALIGGAIASGGYYGPYGYPGPYYGGYGYAPAYYGYGPYYGYSPYYYGYPRYYGYRRYWRPRYGYYRPHYRHYYRRHW